MKCILIGLLAVPAAMGQTTTASIAGTVLDAQTQKPIPVAIVTAVRRGLPPFSRNTKSGGDGAFQLPGLEAGQYGLCVQAPDTAYLDPCMWNGSPVTVTLASGQAATGVAVRLAAASIVRVHVQDATKALNRLTRDGRRPELSVGVWGPDGLYYPARASAGPGPVASLAGGISFQIAVPRDTALKLSIASRDLKLGNDTGAALPGNAGQLTFQHARGDPNPKSFTFTVLSLLP